MSINHNSKILVVGGSGFVGTNLINVLKKHNCYNIDKNCSILHDDISSLHNIQKDGLAEIFPNSTETVILLAAEHKDNVSPASLYYDVNVKGTKNVLDAMSCKGVNKLIFTSTVAVYGLNQHNPSESSQANPFNDYGHSKLEAEKIIYDWYLEDSENRSVVIIRPTVIFGEGNRGNFYKLLKQIVTGKFIKIGDCQNKKSIAYIGNVVEFIKYHADNMKFGYSVYNYADKPDYSMKDMIDLIQRYSGVKVNKISIPYWLGMSIGYLFDFFSFALSRNFSVSSIRIKKFCATTQFDSSKLSRLSFKPKYSMSESIKRTIDFEFLNKN